MFKIRACDNKRITVSDIHKHIQAHVPFRYLLGQHLSLFIERQLHPEISFNSAELDACRKEDVRRIADRLHASGRSITLHAPFMDLRPGAIDDRIRQVSIERFEQLFEIAPLFRPKSIVCHPSFDKRYYVSTEQQWLENSLDTWRRFLPAAKAMDTIIAFENVYEEDPKMLLALVAALDSPHVRICLDTGHFNVFSRTPLMEWVQTIGPQIGQLHLHDNHGLHDEHLPVGEGTFPFRDFFITLRRMGIQPIVTVEPHTEEHLWQTLKNIEDMGLLEALGE